MKMTTAAGMAAVAAAGILAVPGCSVRHTAPEPVGEQAQTQAQGQAQAGEKPASADLDRSTGLFAVAEMPADPYNLAPLNTLSFDAKGYRNLAFRADTHRLVGETVGAKSLANAGEVADAVLALDGGRLAAGMGLAPEMFIGHGIQLEDVGALATQADAVTTAAQRVMAQQVQAGTEAIDAADWADQRGELIAQYQHNIQAVVKGVTPQIAAVATKIVAALPPRGAAGAKVYAVASPSGKWYAVDATGRPAEGASAPDDVLPQIPMPPVRPATPGGAR